MKRLDDEESITPITALKLDNQLSIPSLVSTTFNTEQMFENEQSSSIFKSDTEDEEIVPPLKTREFKQVVEARIKKAISKEMEKKCSKLACLNINKSKFN